MTFKIKDGLALGANTIIDPSGNISLPVTGKLTLATVTDTTFAALNLGSAAFSPVSPVAGDFWYNAGILRLRNGSVTKQIAFIDDNITGTANGTSSIIPYTLGGTGTSAVPTAGGIAYGNGTAILLTSIGSTGNVLTSAAAGAPTWTAAVSTNTINTIVKRDALGDFAAGDITATNFKIGASNVLSSTTLGDGVTASSLTSVGTIGTGTWQGSIVGPTYGGTGVNNGARTLTIATQSGTLTFTGASLTIGALASVAGPNTGDQTITLTGGVTGSGTGSFTTTVQTNANLTGHVSSVGNATSLGSFNFAQLNTAVSDADIARTDDANTFTGIQTFSTPIASASMAVMTNLVGGRVPTPPNNITTFLRGDGVFAAPASVDAGNLSGTTLNSTVTASSLTSVGASLTIGGNTALHTGNYNTYAPTLSGTGATGTWSITSANTNSISAAVGGSYIWTAANYFNSNAGAISAASSTAPLQAYTSNGAGGNAAMMSFHRAGIYAINFGLDTDNVLKVGGGNMGTVSYTILHTGNSSLLTSTGTITSGTWSGSFGVVSGANLTNLTGANVSGNISGSAASLTSARNIAITGDLAWNVNFNGSAPVTAAGTLASIIVAGSAGSSIAIPTLTWDAKGRLTVVSTAAVVAPAGTLSGATLAAGVTASSLTSVGASLTIGGNTALHSGNSTSYASSSISGFNNPTSAATANTIVYRDGTSDITARLFRTEYPVDTGATSSIFLTMNAAGAGADNYARPTSLTAVKTAVVTSAAVTSGLGYTPYNSTNPAGYITSAGSCASATLASGVTINYSNDSNSTYQMLWGSGNGVYGTAGIYCNPFTDQLNVGSLVASGDVTAYSDERLKTNWRGFGEDFVSRLAEIKSGVFDRTDKEMTQVGVSAQSLQKLMPNAIKSDDEGMLQVAYGNAALVACIELAKEVQRLRSELQTLKGV